MWAEILQRERLIGAGDVQQLSVVTVGPGGTVSVEPVLPVRFTRLETL